MKIGLRIIFLCGWMTLYIAGANAQHYGVDSNGVDYTNPKKYTIAATPVVEGLISKNLDVNSLVVRCGLSAGTIVNIPGEDISNAIKSLWKMRLFSQVEIVVDKILGDQIFLTKSGLYFCGMTKAIKLIPALIILMLPVMVIPVILTLKIL